MGSSSVEVAVLYCVFLACYLMLDGLWVSFFAEEHYKRYLTPLLETIPRVLPAIWVLFYSGCVVGFSALPALRCGCPRYALQNGAVLGAFAYGTYAFNNLMLLRAWSWSLALPDVAWGAFNAAVSSYVAVYAAMKLKPDDPVPRSANSDYGAV